jgi:hypothetical protein
MKDSTRTDLHGDEDIEHAEGSGDRHEEVACDDNLGVGADEGAPALAGRSARTMRSEVFPNGARRNLDAELQREFIGDPLLAPCRLSLAMRLIRLRMSAGNWGRPRGRPDFQRQSARNAVRCHLRKISGLTITSASRQLKKRDSAIRVSVAPESWDGV